MRLTADIYNAQGIKQGEGPVWTLTDLNVTRLLDGPGSVTVTSPGTDERALDLLTNERRIRVYGLQSSGIEDQPTLRPLASGILRTIKAKTAPSGWSLSADGPDTLDELTRINTLLARIYSGQTVGFIVRDLAALAGWSVVLDAAFEDKRLQCRFDGTSVLKALQAVAKGQGLHLREGTTERTLEIGAFGQSTGLRLVNAAYAPPMLAGNDDVMLIETLSVSRSSETIINWLVPIGGGQGESAVTLEHCTRQGPYDVRTIVIGEKTLYYLCNDASVAAYGMIQKVGSFKDITPISNSDADLEAAANALYDAAVAWLDRAKERIDTYRVGVKKVRRSIRPGEKIHLTYKGFVTNERGMIVNYVNVDADFWVMRVAERVGLEGISADLELSNIDQAAQDTAQIVISAIEQIQMQNLRVQPNAAFNTFPYGYAIDSTHPINIPIEISNAVLYLNQCRLFVRSMPFRVLAKAQSASDVVTSSGGSIATTSGGGGDHRHKIASAVGTSNSVNGEQIEIFSFPTNADASATTTVAAITRGAGGGGDLYTEASSGIHYHTINIPSHTHTVPAILLDFGIEDDDSLPNTVSLWIDGVDATEALGGPWGYAPTTEDDDKGVAFETTLDITSYLIQAAGGLRQRHKIEFRCTGGQGWIETTVELRTTIQSIAVSN